MNAAHERDISRRGGAWLLRYHSSGQR